MRTSPNVIITGTPGVGKTVHCEQLAQDTGLRYLSINQVAKDRDCFETYDDELDTWVVDEDKVCFAGFCVTIPFLMNTIETMRVLRDLYLLRTATAPRRNRRRSPARRLPHRLARVRSLP